MFIPSVIAHERNATDCQLQHLNEGSFRETRNFRLGIKDICRILDGFTKWDVRIETSNKSKSKAITRVQDLKALTKANYESKSKALISTMKIADNTRKLTNGTTKPIKYKQKKESLTTQFLPDQFFSQFRLYQSPGLANSNLPPHAENNGKDILKPFSFRLF